MEASSWLRIKDAYPYHQVAATIPGQLNNMNWRSDVYGHRSSVLMEVYGNDYW